MLWSGDWVVIIRMVRGYNHGTYYATVIRWTDGGRITVRSDDAREGVKVVSPDNVKKRCLPTHLVNRLRVD